MQSVIKYGHRFAIFRGYYSDFITTGHPCSVARNDISPNTISCGLLSILACSLKPVSLFNLEFGIILPLLNVHNTCDHERYTKVAHCASPDRLAQLHRRLFARSRRRPQIYSKISGKLLPSPFLASNWVDCLPLLTFGVVTAAYNYQVHPCKLDLHHWCLLRRERADLIRSDHHLLVLFLMSSGGAAGTRWS